MLTECDRVIDLNTSEISDNVLLNLLQDYYIKTDSFQGQFKLDNQLIFWWRTKMYFDNTSKK